MGYSSAPSFFLRNLPLLFAIFFIYRSLSIWLYIILFGIDPSPLSYFYSKFPSLMSPYFPGSLRVFSITCIIIFLFILFPVYLIFLSFLFFSFFYYVSVTLFFFFHRVSTSSFKFSHDHHPFPSVLPTRPPPTSSASSSLSFHISSLFFGSSTSSSLS